MTANETSTSKVTFAANYLWHGLRERDSAIAALEMLQGRGVAAAAVAHTSGRIGDSLDMWENGVLSHVNAAASALGLSAGDKVRDKLTNLVS